MFGKNVVAKTVVTGTSLTGVRLCVGVGALGAGGWGRFPPPHPCEAMPPSPCPHDLGGRGKAIAFHSPDELPNFSNGDSMAAPGHRGTTVKPYLRGFPANLKHQ